jgi:hypothetical protein
MQLQRIYVAEYEEQNDGGRVKSKLRRSFEGGN